MAYVIQPGDSLYTIAQNMLGNGNLWPQLAIPGWDGNPLNLQPGMSVSQASTPQQSLGTITGWYGPGGGGTLQNPPANLQPNTYDPNGYAVNQSAGGPTDQFGNVATPALSPAGGLGNPVGPTIVPGVSGSGPLPVDAPPQHPVPVVPVGQPRPVDIPPSQMGGSPRGIPSPATTPPVPNTIFWRNDAGTPQSPANPSPPGAATGGPWTFGGAPIGDVGYIDPVTGQHVGGNMYHPPASAASPPALTSPTPATPAQTPTTTGDPFSVSNIFNTPSATTQQPAGSTLPDFSIPSNLPPALIPTGSTAGQAPHPYSLQAWNELLPSERDAANSYYQDIKGVNPADMNQEMKNLGPEQQIGAPTRFS